MLSLSAETTEAPSAPQLRVYQLKVRQWSKGERKPRLNNHYNQYLHKRWTSLVSAPLLTGPKQIGG